MKQLLLLSFAFAALPVMNVAAQDAFPTADDILWEAPEGTLHANQVRNANSFYDQGEGVAGQDSVNYYTADYVVANDGNIYLKNPFTFFPTETWLRLDKEGDNSYVAHLPQAIYEDEDGTVFYARRMVFNLESTGYLSILPDEQQTDIRFTLRNDTLRSENNGISAIGWPQFFMGLATKKGGWSSYGEVAMTIAPFNLQPLTPPERGTEDNYTLAYKDLYQQDMVIPVPTIRSGNKIYWEVPYTSYNDESYWMEGEIADGKLIVRPQYLGIDTWSCIHLFAVPAQYSAASTGNEPYVLAEELVLPFDKDQASYLPTDETQTILINVGDQHVYFADAYQTPKVQYVKADNGLENPKITNVTPYDAQHGKGSVEFTFPTGVKNSGTDLTKDNLYYRVYVDGSATPYTFRAQQYVGLEEDVTDINFYFANGKDIFSDGEDVPTGSSAGNSHSFTLYEPFDSVGIQTVYRYGTPQKSDIVWSTGSVTDGIVAPCRQPVGAPSLYTLGGARVKHPTRKGVFVRRKVDGTTVKEVLK